MEDVAKQAVIVFNKNVNNTAVFFFLLCDQFCQVVFVYNSGSD